MTACVVTGIARLAIPITLAIAEIIGVLSDWPSMTSMTFWGESANEKDHAKFTNGYPACGNPRDADSENVQENPKGFDRYLSSATPGYTFLPLFTLPGLVLLDRPHAGRAYVQLVCQDPQTRKAK